MTLGESSRGPSKWKKSITRFYSVRDTISNYHFLIIFLAARGRAFCLSPWESFNGNFYFCNRDRSLKCATTFVIIQIILPVGFAESNYMLVQVLFFIFVLLAWSAHRLNSVGNCSDQIYRDFNIEAGLITNNKNLATTGWRTKNLQIIFCHELDIDPSTKNIFHSLYKIDAEKFKAFLRSFNGFLTHQLLTHSQPSRAKRNNYFSSTVNCQEWRKRTTEERFIFSPASRHDYAGRNGFDIFVAG